MDGVYQFVERVQLVILNPIITLLVVLGFVVFLYGVAEYVFAQGEEGRSRGARHLMWGVIGITIMVSVFGILRMIRNTVGSDVIVP